MRLLKSNSILSLANSYLVDSPQPSSISYMWNFGSLLALCLGLQIITGVFLAMHYNPSVELAFTSVEHIMRDVNLGWAIRYTHANVASFFFIFVYAHIGRGLYYGSYKAPRVLPWSIGVIILVLMMATAFLGYNHSLTWIDNIDLIFNDSLATLPITASLKAILTKHNLNPVTVWENLDKPGVKSQVYVAIKPLAFYLIVNLINGKMYVGSSVIARMHNRFHKHLFSGQGNKLVWNAVNKYGITNFAFLVLETIPGFVSKDNKILLKRIDLFHYLILNTILRHKLVIL